MDSPRQGSPLWTLIVSVNAGPAISLDSCLFPRPGGRVYAALALAVGGKNRCAGGFHSPDPQA
jgi:hypothetical protein